MGTTQFVFRTARQSFIDKHHAVLVDYMEDMLRIERWYLDPKNHDEVAKIASDLLKIPPERFGWVFTKKDYYRDPDMMPDLAALQRNVDTTADMGFIKSQRRRQESFRSQSDRRGGETAEVTRTYFLVTANGCTIYCSGPRCARPWRSGPASSANAYMRGRWVRRRKAATDRGNGRGRHR